MAKKPLIIVESPAKIKTLKKFLGGKYEFESSVGHIRDLPEREFGIDIENDFEPDYQTMPDKKQVIDKLKKAAKEADVVYLSPDPDREGEAIAWHISQILPKNTVYKRISFNAITKDEVQRALSNPREIDLSLVNAQQARRLLDRIVGYKISPILNRRIQRGKEKWVSAGRVQSVALKLVVDREKEIEAFKPVEYWNLNATLTKAQESRNFQASLFSVQGKKIEKEAVEGKDYFLIPNKETADSLLKRLEGANYQVEKVERKEKKRQPIPPFITSTLQQEASRHFGYSSSKTMQIAQGLYEGIDLGNEGAEGLITYMRTDSVRVQPEVITEARDYIKNTFGKEYVPESARHYATKKNSQDAHEAIRPTNIHHHPEKVKNFLTKEQFNLYQLIWQRFISSQMEAALYDTLTADIRAAKDFIFRATGSVLKFKGWLAAYLEMEDEPDKENEEKALPDLQEGGKLNLIELLADQSFTRPPPRFTEASLVKELEKLGIGRPSTFASIMMKIQSRDYTVKEQGRLKPTELGCVIADLLETNFQKIMDIGFTAAMEDTLELVADSKKNWKEILREFWTDFAPTLEAAQKGGFVPKLMTDRPCPKCGKNLQKVWFKSKYFFGCSDYPNCDYSAPVEEVEFDRTLYAEDFNWDQPCPKCGSPMKTRHGKFGTFLGCTKYPECRGIVQIPKKGEKILSPEEMPPCPAVGCPGKIQSRRSRFGKIFYSCTSYPDCDVIGNSLDAVNEKYHNHPRTPAVVRKKGKTTTKKEKAPTKAKKATSKKTAVKKERPKKEQPKKTLSKELQAVLKEDSLSRGDVLKKLWDYIRANDLQDPKDKRMIKPDVLLAKVFGGTEPVNMMKLAGILKNHIS